MHSEEDPPDGAGDRRRRRRSRRRRGERLRGPSRPTRRPGHDDERRRRLLEHGGHHRHRHRQRGHRLRLPQARRWPRAAHDRPTSRCPRRAHADGEGPAACGRHHKLKYWAQDVNGNVEAQQVVSFTVGIDTAKPVTSATGATDGGWYKTGVTVRLAAADGAGESGVEELSYALDGAAPTGRGDSRRRRPGRRRRAHDRLSRDRRRRERRSREDVHRERRHLEAGDLRLCRLGGQGPHGDAEVQGHRDAAPTQGKATVVIKIKNRTGKVVKTIKAGHVDRQRHAVGEVHLHAGQGRLHVSPCTRPTWPATRRPRPAPRS